jgi:hypothetical protein
MDDRDPVPVAGAPATDPVVWVNVVGATASGNDLSKTAVVGWNAGASSSQALSTDGYLQVTLGDTPGYTMVGLSADDPDTDWQSIDYALYTYPPNGQLYVYENGTFRTTLGAFAPGDTLRVELAGDQIVYWRNGAAVYTSPTAPTLPLYADVAMYSVGANVQDAVFLGASIPGVTWTNVVGAATTPTTLTKTAATGWGNGGASSLHGLATGDFGYADFVVADDPGYAMFGLGTDDSSAGYEDIEYAFYTYPPSGRLYIYESGTFRATPGLYAAGDALRVQVELDQITYWRNGALVYTSTVAPTYPLRVDTALYSIGAVVEGATLDGDLVDLSSPPLVPEAVAWTAVAGATANGNDLTKTAGAGWGNGGASSTRGLATGAAGYAEFTLSAAPGYAMFGLGTGDTSADFPDIEYAFYTYPPSGVLYIFEGGTARATVGSYAAGDTLRVAVDDDVVSYWRNGARVYTSAVVPTYPLRADTALYSVGANVNDAMLAGDVVDLVAPPLVPEAVVWQHVAGADATGNDLTKTAGTGWGNAGASSTRGIMSAGYAELTVPDAPGYAMFGLSNGDGSTNYDDIDYAFYTYPPTGQLYIFEGGTARAVVGNYAVGDTLRVSVSGSTVTYSRNGVVVRTSGVAPTFPLRVDTSLYSTGATVTDALIAGDLADVP